LNESTILEAIKIMESIITKKKIDHKDAIQLAYCLGLLKGSICQENKLGFSEK
jgi:hypothetical protein